MGRETVEPRRAARSVEAAICGSAEANSALWPPLPPAGAVRKTNPVFSVYQMDVICYGVDLEDWFQRERNRWLEWSGRPIKEIRFWSEALCKNNAEPVVTGR